MPLPLIIISAFFFKLNSLAHDLFDSLKNPELYSCPEGLERVQYDLSVGYSIISELQRLLSEAQAGGYPETTGKIEQLLSYLNTKIQELKAFQEKLMLLFPATPSGK